MSALPFEPLFSPIPTSKKSNPLFWTAFISLNAMPHLLPMRIDSLSIQPPRPLFLRLPGRKPPGKGPFLHFTQLSHLTCLTHLTDATHVTLVTFLTLATCLFAGCATYKRTGLAPAHARSVEQQFHPPALTPELENKILALDPLHVNEKDIREVLSHAPAPRIINIHGGIYPVHRRMISFSQFLIGMGYPAFSITNANDGTYTFSCYESSDLVAGMIAWYYEKEGLRPIIVGHSQGGFQAVKILHRFAGHDSETMAVWNPLTWSRENRYRITDPLTGKERPGVGP